MRALEHGISSKLKRLASLAIAALASAATSPSSSPLWNNWYTVTDHGRPDSYYNEKAELVGDRAKIQVNTWIKQKSLIKEETLGAVAKNTIKLEPLIYNFRSQLPGSEARVIDGSIVDNGKVFSVKIKSGEAPVKPLRAEMLPDLILTSFFPLWIHKNYKRINGVQPIEFHAIVEDQVQTKVPVVTGTAYEMREDDFAKKTKTRKLRIEFNKTVAIWWVTNLGDALKIEAHELDRVVTKVSQKTAETFLKP